MRINIKLPLLITLVMVFSNTNSYAEQWVRTFDGSTTQGFAGTITLDDWGFIGPQGRQADSFEPYGGAFGNGMYDSSGAEFCIADPAACDIGQMQHVVVSGPDGITPDAPAFIEDDFTANTGDFENANVDSLTNFYYWGWTSKAGSTFNNMLIDFNGNYRIAQNDMTFEFYDIIDYKQVIADGEVRIGDNPDSDPDATPPIIYYNSLNFQPYAISDAIGWCGSILTSHPNAHEAMAGQVKFDIVMDVYIRNADGTFLYLSSELTPDFEMRSFGDIEVSLDNGTDRPQIMNARAVVNNTDPGVPNQSVGPDTPVGDLSWHNKVSFMGANVLQSQNWCGIESAQWLTGARGPGVKRYAEFRRDLTSQVACEAESGVWAFNIFGGYGYILRADAGRYIDYFDESVYGPDPMTIDLDGDGVLDIADNCTLVENPGQQDTDGDNYGNACDADFNNDTLVNSLDIGLFKQMFLMQGDLEADLNGDNIVNSLDIGLFKARFLLPVGPSGTAQ